MSRVDKLLEKIINEGSEDLNPTFVFQTFDSRLLNQIVTGKIKVQKIAAIELANRGLDKNLKWVGFDQAEEIWKKDMK